MTGHEASSSAGVSNDDAVASSSHKRARESMQCATYLNERPVPGLLPHVPLPFVLAAVSCTKAAKAVELACVYPTPVSVRVAVGVWHYRGNTAVWRPTPCSLTSTQHPLVLSAGARDVALAREPARVKVVVHRPPLVPPATLREPHTPVVVWSGGVHNIGVAGDTHKASCNPGRGQFRVSTAASKHANVPQALSAARTRVVRVA